MTLWDVFCLGMLAGIILATVLSMWLDRNRP